MMDDFREMTKTQKIILHSASALIPILFLGVAFALHDVYPFGDRQILVTDFWQQYYPFLSEYWHRVREGSSFLWSWTSGGGHDYLAHFAYYMASPLNLLTALFPHYYLREALTVFVLLRIGLAGFFMSAFLRFTLKKYDILLPVFSSFYALCAFATGYYWNIMWLDTFAMLPLVLLGTYALVRDGKYKLYTISLALAVLFNFYIGVFICIIVGIMFFVQCFVSKLSIREFLQRLITIAVSSALALGMAAVLILPTYSALQNSYRAETAFPDFRVINSFTSVLGNFIAFNPPTSLDGLPNLYSGMISIMLIPIFLLTNKISIREKITYMAVLIFLVLSVNINILDFMWNGFTITNMIPFRFSFIASFIVVFMAYKAYVLMDDIKREDILAMMLSGMLFLWMATAGEQYSEYIVYSTILGVVYLSLFIFVGITKKIKLFKYAFLIVIFTELAFSAHGGVGAVRTTYRSYYAANYEPIQQLFEYQQSETPDFFRTEFTRWRILNDPSFYGYNGISFFSSLANVNATNFMLDLGLPGWESGNRFTFGESTPITHAFLNMRYLITRDHHIVGDGILWDHVGSVDTNHLFRNTRYLPFGFMVNEEIVDYVGDRHNPFNSQNDLFRKATGLDDDVFTIIDIIHVGHRNYDVRRLGLGEYSFALYEYQTEGTLRFNYEMPADGIIYTYLRFPDYFNHTGHVRVTVGDTVIQWIYNRRPYIFAGGSFSHEEIVSIEADLEYVSGTGSIFVGFFNQEVFDQGIEMLAAETLTITEFSDTNFAGTITVSEPRLLYTSLPYAGNWRVFVNGNEEEIVTIGGAMAGVRLDAGDHTVEFRYHDRSFDLGVLISATCFVIYLLLILLQRKGIDVFELAFSRLFSSKLFSPKEKKEKANFLLFGILTTLVSWVVYSIAVQTIGFSITVSNIIAWVFAVVFAFFTNKKWVFEDNDWSPPAMLSQASTFLSSRIVTGVIEILGVPLLFLIGIQNAVFGIEGFAARLVISVVVVILNYVLSKKFVFKSSKPVERSA